MDERREVLGGGPAPPGLTSTSFEAINALSATGIPDLVRHYRSQTARRSIYATLIMLWGAILGPVGYRKMMNPSVMNWSAALLNFLWIFHSTKGRHNGESLFWQRIPAATSIINAILPITSTEPAFFGVYADDFP